MGNPVKLCECGCGQPAPISGVTDRRKGWVKGKPRRFIHGHNTRRQGVPYPPSCGHTPEYARGLCKRCYDKAYCANNAAKSKRVWGAYYKKHSAHLRSAQIKRYQADPEKHIAAHRKWQRAHPNMVKALIHRRRAMLKGNGGSWTAAEWETLKRQLGHRCVGCWKTEKEINVLGRKLVPDHIIPVVKGGLNDITNIQPLCHGRGGCNNKKGKKYIDYLVA
jgi:hypothetical protein